MEEPVVDFTPGPDFLRGGGLDDGVDPPVRQYYHGLRQLLGVLGADGAVGHALADDGLHKAGDHLGEDAPHLRGQKLGVVHEVGHHAEHLGLALRLEGGLEHGPQLLQPVQGGVVTDPGQHLAVPPPDAVADGVENVLLGGKVVVDGPLGKARLVDDLLEGGPVIARLNKQPLRRVQDLPHRLLRVLVPCHRAVLPSYKPLVGF